MLLLIPTILSENGTDAIPKYVLEAIKRCTVLFVEDERTSRRYLKKICPDIVIDHFQWHRIDTSDFGQKKILLDALKEGQEVGVLSEAGCPGVADPGQQLAAWAQEAGFIVKPFVGPNSILLALMASGLNGQDFHFHGYLPVKDPERISAIKQLEQESRKQGCTQIFIETPYRNNALIASLLQHCHTDTRLCIAVDITGENESIRTKKIGEWKMLKPILGKIPAIFLLGK